MVHITPLVIYSLVGTDTHTNVHMDVPHRINFKKPGMLAFLTPGLTSLKVATTANLESLLLYSNNRLD